MAIPTCTCWFCGRGEEHPDDRHPNFHRIGSHLLVAESLKPEDRIDMVACLTCGHRRSMDEADTQ